MNQDLLVGIVLGIIVVCILTGLSFIDPRNNSDQIRSKLVNRDREGTSLSELVRELLRRAIAENEKKSKDSDDQTEE